MKKKEKETEELIDQLSSIFRSELKELLTTFGSFSSFKFLDFELSLQRKLRDIGRKTLEESIPYLYGDGYVL